MSAHSDAYTEASIPYNPSTGSVVVRIHQPRFLCRGRVEQETYNWASLSIEFVPARHLAEWVLLAQYLDSYADRPIPLEQAAAAIYDHLRELLRPASLVVKLRTTGDGGFAYEVEVR